MAIATGNIKVNGRWYKAGESYEPETVQEHMPVETGTPEQMEEAQKPEKAARKPRTTTRRKVSE